MVWLDRPEDGARAGGQQFGVMIAKATGLNGASPRARNRVPPVGKVSAGSTGEGIDVEDGTSRAKVIEPYKFLPGAAERDVRHPGADEMVSRPVVDGRGQVAGELRVVGHGNLFRCDIGHCSAACGLLRLLA